AADFDKAVELNPQLADAYGNRGLALLAQGKDAEAQQDFEKSFKLDASLKSYYEEAARKIKQTRTPPKSN
ncbi:MAG TPA: tetratricopeptide repeat protein, partial [Pyrinomonadaceae bacterium]|nr:tetratricopeptide repeat protein [Pyrinomonadaceae bacterium]